MLGQQLHFFGRDRHRMGEHQVVSQTARPGHAGDRPASMSTLGDVSLREGSCQMVGGAHPQSGSQFPGAHMKLQAAGLLALDVHPHAQASLGGAVPGPHRLLQGPQGDFGIGEEVVIDHFRGPSRGNLLRLHVGGVPAGNAPDAGLLDGGRHRCRVVLGAHVQKTGGPSPEHLGGSQQGSHRLVLGTHVGIEGLGPVEYPGAGVDHVGKHRPGQGLGQMHVRIHEPGGHPQPTTAETPG